MTRQDLDQNVGNYKSKFKLEDSKHKQLSKMNSGRNRQNKQFNSSSETPSYQKQKPTVNTFGRVNQNSNQITSTFRSPSNYNYPRQQYQRAQKTSVATNGMASPSKDTNNVVYRAVDEQQQMIDNGINQDKSNMPHIESEFISSSPTKFDQLMKPVRQQSTGQMSNGKLLSPTKSSRIRYSHIQANQKENRDATGMNDLNSLNSQSMPSNQRTHKTIDNQSRTQNSE